MSAALELAFAPEARARAVAERSVVFFAASTPKPKGSHKAISIAGKARLAPASSGEKGWRAAVANAAAAAMKRERVRPLECCVEVHMAFFSPRPRAHRRTNGSLKPGSPPRPPTAPDADKLARSVGDALNGVCWRDDAQVVRLVVDKLYTDEAQPYVGVRVTVKPYMEAR